MQNKLGFRFLALLAAFLFLITPLFSVSRAETREYVKYSYMFFGTFDTAITILGYAQSQEIFDEAVQLAEKQFTNYHRQFDQYHSYPNLNNIYVLNREASKNPISVPPELFNLIDYCKRMESVTNGKVNIALGAVLSLWHEAREVADLDPENAALPGMADLMAAARHVNLDDVVLDAEKQTVFYKDPLLKLDVGAVAKGYATERVARELLQGKLQHFIINAGGNVRTGSPPLDGRNNWNVAIQDPNAALFFANDGDILDLLYLHDQSAVTSGDYQRFFTVDDKRYYHIISPDTLMPSSYMRSVTIITEDSALADLLSTAVFLMPFEEGLEFVMSFDGVEALWVLNDNSVRMTPGAEQFAYSKGAKP